jgi:RNA polymerase sigma-70 factor (ECF subfamily)
MLWPTTATAVIGLGGIMQVQVNDVDEDGEIDQLARDVAKHVAALRRFALVLVGNASEADAMVQECLRRGLVRMRSWRPARDLRVYLFTTLHDVFAGSRRRQKIQRSDVALEQAIASRSWPASELKRLEFRSLVAAMQDLPAPQREVVLLIGLEGMSYKEAADVLGVPVRTVMSRLSRGREALRQLTAQTAASRLQAVR